MNSLNLVRIFQLDIDRKLSGGEGTHPANVDVAIQSKKMSCSKSEERKTRNTEHLLARLQCLHSQAVLRTPYDISKPQVKAWGTIQYNLLWTPKALRQTSGEAISRYEYFFLEQEHGATANSSLIQRLTFSIHTYISPTKREHHTDKRND